MIYVDSSSILAHILTEDRQPPPTLWDEDLVSSRLLEYEVWVRIHSRGLGDTHRGTAERLMGALDLLELSPAVQRRAL